MNGGKLGIGRGVAEIAIVLAPVVICAVLVTAYPLGADQGMYATVADGLRGRLAPYRDLFDIKPPGVYYAYVIAFTLAGRAEAAPRWLDVIGAAAAGLAVWGISRRRWGKVPASLAGGLTGFVSLTAFDFWNLSQPENYAGALTALAFWFASGPKSTARPGRLLTMGVLMGGVFWLKYTAALPIIALWFLGGLRGERFVRGAVRTAVWTSGGFLATSGVIVAVLLWMGSGPAFWELNARLLPRYYTAAYPGGLWTNLTSVVWPTARTLAQLAPFLIVPAVIGAAYAAVRRRDDGFWVAAAWFIAALFSVVIQKRFYLYHLAILPAAVGVFAAPGLKALGEGFRRKKMVNFGRYRAGGVVGPRSRLQEPFYSVRFINKNQNGGDERGRSVLRVF